MAFVGFVVGKDISQLGPDDLRTVLNTLLLVEANAHSVAVNRLELSARNNDADEGVDARLDWPKDKPNEILPAGKVVVQYKAGKLSGAGLGRELDKPGVKRALKRGAHYLLLVGFDYSPTNSERWRKKLTKLFRNRKFSIKRAHIVFGSRIAQWASQYPSIVILPELRKNVPLFQTVSLWSRQHDLGWKPDLSRTETIGKLREFLQGRSQNNVVRVQGPAGVGKTRVVLEAVRERGLAEAVIYSPNAEDGNVLQLLAFVVSNTATRAIVVIDECSHDKQDVFRPYVDASVGRLRLLCVGTPDLLAPRLGASPSLILLGALPDEQIKEILKEVTSPVPDEIVDLAVKLSRGLVKLAIFVVRQLVQAKDISLTDLARIGDVGEFLRRFVKPEILDTLEAFSLFARLGWDEELQAEAKAVSNYLEIPFKEMKAGVHALSNQGVLMAQGRYLYVTPDLLAIFAAAELWETDGPGLIEIVSSLPGIEPRRQLLIRIAAMGQHANVKRAVERLLGEEGIYKTLPDLDDEFRSEMFRILSSALPDAASEVLERVISRSSFQELKGFETGRRNTMWAIESLLRWPNTSLIAARALMALALSETESIGNNATGIFSQYFHMYLSGSPVPITGRLELIDELIAREDSDSRTLAAKALGAGLKSYESRMGGEVDQISGIPFPREWRPSTVEELRLGRKAIITRAQHVAEGEDDAARTARGELVGSIFTLIREGFWKDGIDVLEGLRPANDKEKRDVLDAAKRIEREVKDRLSPNEKERLRLLSNAMFDMSFRGRLQRWVGHRLHADYDLEGKTGFRDADAETESIAKEAMDNGVSDEEWKWLATPEAENVWLFGVAVGKLDRESKFLEKIVEASAPNINCLLLASYLMGQAESRGDLFRETYLDALAISQPILAAASTWRGKSSSRGLRRLLNLVDSGAIEPRLLGYLSYGGWTNSLSADEIADLLSRLLRGSPEDVMDPATGIVLGLIQRSPTSFETIEDLLWQMIGIVPKRNWQWEWGQLANQLAVRAPERITRIILSFLGDRNFVPLSNDPEMEALSIATRSNPKACWELIANALLREDISAHQIVAALHGWYGELIPADELVRWAKANLPRGPRIVAELILVKGSPIPERARKLLITFPEDKYVKSAIAGDLWSGAWVGPYSKKVELDLQIAKGWLEDDDPRIRDFARGVVKNLETALKRELTTEEEEGLADNRNRPI